jgi:hypothetical protein
MAGESAHPDVKEIKTVPYVPLSHPFVERVIGTIRRECLDRTLFWTAADLEMKLLEFRRYYNIHRARAALEGRTPDASPAASAAQANIHSYRWRSTVVGCIRRRSRRDVHTHTCRALPEPRRHSEGCNVSTDGARMVLGSERTRFLYTKLDLDPVEGPP